VVHLAAKVGLGVGLGDLDDYVSSNDLGTAVLLQTMASHDVGRLVLAGSMVVYGDGSYTCPEDGQQQAPPRSAADLAAGRFEPHCPACGNPLEPGLTFEDAPIDPRNGYAATKLHQEHLAAVFARETGATVASMRFHNVYGPGMPYNTPYAGVASIFLSELAAGRPPRVHEDGAQRRDFVHVADVARAVTMAAEIAQDPAASPLRTYNVGSGRVTTVGQMARLLSEATGGPRPVLTGQYRLGDVRHITASSQRAADELGWRAQITLERGLGEFAAAPGGSRRR
jgi:dTDP-L-rhamnose 4-epimerase